MISVAAALLFMSATPAKVEVVRVSDRWRLLRNGQPYRIQGAGGTSNMAELVAAGGNSMRTWGVDKAGEELDRCQRHHLTLTVGIWLGHRSYFDYSDPAKVKQQYEMVREAVTKHRRHPALLMWGLGNEMEADQNDNEALWRAIEDLAKLCKSLDPNHPTMTVVAEITPQKIANIKKFAPSLDILGINSYGGLPSLPKRLKDAGWEKPYVVTEFGPPGPWERPKTPWGAALEQTSSDKAVHYAEGYRKAIDGQKDWCLGSYAFLWGHKQEETPTWFGMFLPTGERTEAIDVMSHAWTGKWPKNRAPIVRGFELSVAQQEVAGSARATAKTVAKDPDGDPLSYRWELMREVEDKRYAGEGEQRPGVLSGIVDKFAGAAIQFNVPEQPGAYRLYVTVKDGKGNGATANLPFRVRR